MITVVVRGSSEIKSASTLSPLTSPLPITSVKTSLPIKSSWLSATENLEKSITSQIERSIGEMIDRDSSTREKRSSSFENPRCDRNGCCLIQVGSLELNEKMISEKLSGF